MVKVLKLLISGVSASFLYYLLSLTPLFPDVGPPDYATVDFDPGPYMVLQYFVNILMLVSLFIVSYFAISKLKIAGNK